MGNLHGNHRVGVHYMPGESGYRRQWARLRSLGVHFPPTACAMIHVMPEPSFRNCKHTYATCSQYTAQTGTLYHWVARHEPAQEVPLGCFCVCHCDTITWEHAKIFRTMMLTRWGRLGWRHKCWECVVVHRYYDGAVTSQFCGGHCDTEGYIPLDPGLHYMEFPEKDNTDVYVGYHCHSTTQNDGHLGIVSWVI